jgi:hypothetical protein
MPTRVTNVQRSIATSYSGYSGEATTFRRLRSVRDLRPRVVLQNTLTWTQFEYRGASVYLKPPVQGEKTALQRDEPILPQFNLVSKSTIRTAGTFYHCDPESLTHTASSRGRRCARRRLVIRRSSSHACACSDRAREVAARYVESNPMARLDAIARRHELGATPYSFPTSIHTSAALISCRCSRDALRPV